METFGYVSLGVLVVALLAVLIRLAVRNAHTCELCKKPRDPRTKVAGAWKYGVLACDDCGRKLEERYKDDHLPAEPPPCARP
jgi:ribosomal protein L37AE/L43A